MEELRGRHRKEQQELQARITQKKKSATKKTRKGVNDECDHLLREFQERLDAERAELDGGDNTLIQDLDSLILDDDVKSRLPGGDDGATKRDASPARETGEKVDNGPRPRKPNRQKARMARRTAEQAALAVDAEQEAASLPDLRGQEQEAMRKHFSSSGLREVEVRPDGHCLYSAVAHQLALTSSKAGKSNIERNTRPADAFQNVRDRTANYISQNPDQFTPFLDEPLDEYSRKVKETAEWGGQLELQAISKAYGVQVNVLQATGEVIKFDSDGTAGQEPCVLWLAYYRHHYGLGEHYNALVRASGP
ncbi:MAG: hypothetical protein Q9160_007437 [Pyrenula sp. 1 TL-2023]